MDLFTPNLADNQIKILELLLEKKYMQKDLQKKLIFFQTFDTV